MAEYAALDSALYVGTQQTHYATIVVAGPTELITNAGDATFAVIAAGMGGGGDIDTSVALALGDNAADVARKAAIELNLDVDIAAWMTFYAVGNLLYCRLNEAAADDATLELEFIDDTCVGLTADDAGTPGATGVAEEEVAQVTNISGPGLGLDTEDVTTHDSTAAWEEVVGTILRSGEISLDLVFDPADDTQDAVLGLVYRLEDKVYSFFKLIFSDAASTEWESEGYVIGFEPSASVGGALTGVAKIKITGQPLLA